MKQVSRLLGLVLAVGMVLGFPLSAMAAEHGGQEHAGGATAADTGMMMKWTPDQEAWLKSAVEELNKIGNTEWANKVQAWIDGKGEGDMAETLKKVSDAVRPTNPVLADNLWAWAEKEGKTGEAKS